MKGPSPLLAVRPVVAASTSAPRTTSIDIVGLEDAAALSAVARLHVDLLPHGLGQLGGRFLIDFLYLPGLRARRLHVGLACLDGDPVGFVTFTTSSRDYAAAGLGHQLPRALMALAASAVRDPRILGAAWRMLRKSGERAEGDIAEAADAEILAFGVLPEYRSGAFVRATGIRFSRALFDHAAARLGASGARSVQANVEADNLATLQFYRYLGGRFVTMPPGHALQRVIVDLETPPAES